MQLRYKDATGQIVMIQLETAESLTVGRDSTCDIVIQDEKASRKHCEIRLWQDDYVIKDLKSQNGTRVNDELIGVLQLNPGDVIKIGSTSVFFEVKTPVGDTTAFREVEEEMQEGKGYRTILRKIVKDINEGDSD